MKYHLLFTMLFVCCSFFAQSQIHYVKIGGSGDGSSWENAFGRVQQAINEAEESGGSVWVAEGTYFPVECTDCTEEDQDATFMIYEDFLMLGGFPNTGNPTMDDRDSESYPTILSGNIGDPSSSLDNVNNIVTSEAFSVWMALLFLMQKGMD